MKGTSYLAMAHLFEVSAETLVSVAEDADPRIVALVEEYFMEKAQELRHVHQQNPLLGPNFERMKCN